MQSLGTQRKIYGSCRDKRKTEFSVKSVIAVNKDNVIQADALITAHRKLTKV